MSAHYVGKDLVHYGSGIVLDPERAYRDLDHSARKNIRRAEKAGFNIKRCRGSAEELNQLRELWYCPEDPNFPVELAEKEILYLAYLDDELVGGMVLVPVGSHLFLNNLTASDKGKRQQLQGYLLWHAVNDLNDSEYTYIDIGVSYRINLQRFFTKWASFRYPVILNPPALKPSISFYPFGKLPYISNTTGSTEQLAIFCTGRPVTILPSIEYARVVAEAQVGQWRETQFPYATDELLVVDMTRVFPSQYGALLVGVELAAEDLWDQFGCYDYYKSQYLARCMALPEWNIETIRKKRYENYQSFLDRFDGEDICVEAIGEWIPGFRFSSGDAVSLHGWFSKFGIEAERTKDTLTLPCHQGLSEQDVEYIYAAYRGYLNLCSEWQSTCVKGAIKLTG